METLTPATKSPVVTTKLTLTVEDASGFVHTLEAERTGGDEPQYSMLGNNILLIDLLYRMVAGIDRQERNLF